MIWGFEKASVARQQPPGSEGMFASEALRTNICILGAWKSRTAPVCGVERLTTRSIGPPKPSNRACDVDSEPFREDLRLNEVTWLLRIFLRTARKPELSSVFSRSGNASESN